MAAISSDLTSSYNNHDNFEGCAFTAGLRRSRALEIGGMPLRAVDRYAIYFGRAGRQEMWLVENGRRRRVCLAPGRILIVRAGVLHGGRDGNLQAGEYGWVELDLAEPHQPLKLSPRQAEQIQSRLETVSHRLIVASDQMSEAFEELFDELKQQDSLAPTGAATALYRLVLRIIRHVEHQTKQQPNQHPRLVGPTARWINSQLRHDFELNELAAHVKMTPNRLRHLFREQTGFSPGEYQMRRRIVVARKLLRRTRQSSTQIAFELGFSTSQYFSAVFRKQTGLTPGEYRRCVKV